MAEAIVVWASIDEGIADIDVEKGIRDAKNVGFRDIVFFKNDFAKVNQVARV